MYVRAGRPAFARPCMGVHKSAHYIYRIWFGWLLWNINHSRLFNTKFSLYIYIKYIGFGLVGFYCILTIVGFFNAKSSLLHIYILDIRGAYDKFPDFYRIGTFIDSTHMKLKFPSE